MNFMFKWSKLLSFALSAVFSNTNRNFERTSYAQALKEDDSLCAEVDEDQHLLGSDYEFTHVGSRIVVSQLFSAVPLSLFTNEIQSFYYEAK